MSLSIGKPAAGAALDPAVQDRSTVPPGHWLIIPVMIVAACLRTQAISSFSMHCDEGFVQRMVEFPWGEMLERLGHDTHPPLFYVINKLWVGIVGESIVAGRALSVLLGVSAVAGIYLFVREACLGANQSSAHSFLEADLPGLVAAMILTLTPLQIFWSMQIRMYSLAVALTVWSSYLLVRAWKRGGWAAYTICAIMLSLTHYFGLFIVVSQYLCSFGRSLIRDDRPWWERVRPAALSACCLWLAWQPWMPYFLQQRGSVEQSFFLPKPSWSVLGSIMHEVWIDFGLPPSPMIGLIIAQSLFVVLLLLLLNPQPGSVLIAVSAAFPLVAAIAISAVSRSILNGRYFLLMQTFWMAAIAIVLCRFWVPWRFAALGILASGMCWTCGIHCQRRDAQSRLPGMQSAIAKIEAAGGGEPVVVCNPLLFVSAISYTTDRKQMFLYRPPHGFPFFQGTAVIRDEQYIDETGLKNCDARYLWALDADGSFGSVRVPREWLLVREEAVSDGYVSLIIRLYARESDRLQAKFDQPIQASPRSLASEM